MTYRSERVRSLVPNPTSSQGLAARAVLDGWLGGPDTKAWLLGCECVYVCVWWLRPKACLTLCRSVGAAGELPASRGVCLSATHHLLFQPTCSQLGCLPPHAAAAPSRPSLPLALPRSHHRPCGGPGGRLQRRAGATGPGGWVGGSPQQAGAAVSGRCCQRGRWQWGRRQWGRWQWGRWQWGRRQWGCCQWGRRQWMHPPAVDGPLAPCVCARVPMRAGAGAGVPGTAGGLRVSSSVAT